LHKYVKVNFINHMASIYFVNNYSSKNDNIAIFISNLKELNNISLPEFVNIDFKNTLFRDNLEITKEITLNHRSNNKKYISIYIKIIDKNSSGLIIGSDVLNKVSSKNNNITLIFSNNLQKSKNKNIIPDIIFGLGIKSYSFDKYMSNKELKKFNFYINKLSKNLINKINYNSNLLYSMNYCKDLVSEPANILNPVTFAKKCQNLKIKNLNVKVLNISQLKKYNMNSILAVAKGSEIEPKVVILEWNIKKTKKPTLLIGKGVTFDTGGISLKPSSGMEEMITDMGGSAVVVGSLINAALNNFKSSLVGIVGLVENMPDGKAQRPGDIIKSMSGKTIEVLNTDAEGRLVLADLLSYAQKFYNPSQIIDFATLTGAIMIALGTHKAGIFSNNNSLSSKMQKAGEIVNENLWRMPLGSEYDSEINTLRADMKNIGSSRFGGSTHAAQFLYRFIENNIPWAHIDIAGVSWTLKGGINSSSKLHKPGATAFGIRLIDQFLKG
tara:strand:- start:4941 stop:6431 length:1491 start_codon:yes stop_codon:yes gene_type:complete